MNLAPSPGNVVALLRQGDPAARALLAGLCRDSIGRLVDRVMPRSAQAYNRTLMVDRTLRWVEMYLKARGAGEFQEMTRERFLAHVLAAAFKMLSTVDSAAPAVAGHLQEEGAGNRCPATAADAGGRASGVRELSSSVFTVWTYTRPLECAGGDWAGLKIEGDGSLWVFMADVTGHGYPAHVIAHGLPWLWETRAIAQRRSDGRQPGDVLDALSHELEQVLPENVFVEAALIHVTPAGRAWASGAGNCRLLLRESGADRLDLRRMGGLWLGLGLGSHDQQSWDLKAGDEIALATDGLYEQPDLEGKHLELSLVARTGARLAPGRSLHDAIVDTLHDTLSGAPQKDDILVVTVRVQPGPSPDQETGHAGL
jgi:hypothetical protein